MVPSLWRTFRLVLLLFIASLLAAPSALAARAFDPAVPPDPSPAPAGPTLLPPYAVWESTPVPEAGIPTGFDMAIGKDGRIHLAVAEARTGQLMYMVGAPGKWITSTVEVSSTARFWDPSIVLDSDDEPRIAYLHFGECTTDGKVVPYGLVSVRYAEHASGSWSITDVQLPPSASLCAVSNSVLNRTDLVLDGDGRPWISWVEHVVVNPPDVEYGRVATRTSSGNWLHSTLAKAEEVYVRLAVSPSGQVNAAWSATTINVPPPRADLWYGVWRNGVLDATRLGPERLVWNYPQIAVDPLGRIFVTGNNTKPTIATLWRGEDSVWTSDALNVPDLIDYAAITLGVAVAGDGLPALVLWKGAGVDGSGLYFYWWDGFSWRHETMGQQLGQVSLVFDGDTPILGYLRTETASLGLLRRVPAEDARGMWLPTISR